MFLLNIDHFITKYITERPESLFKTDLELNHALLQSRIDGRSVLVIGGAGTIGASFVKALLHFNPARLYVVDINENGLTELTRDLRSSLGLHIPTDYKTYPINFGDAVFEKLLQQEGPFDIVANFAAHKHVRSEKDHYSIEAMLENNVLKNKRLLELLRHYPPQHFFCVSTDKAANPVNVMGASKKLMEELLLVYAQRMPISTARFANVAFSNGSLPDGFLQRLQKRQPLSAPTDVQRYFVSPQESGELCLLACVLGEPGDIFFPKLAETQVKTFSDIGTALLQELGYEPDFCSSEQEAREKAARLATELSTARPRYPVYYFASDTSGEKPFEEFYTDTEVVDWQRFSALGVIKAKPAYTFDELEVIFNNIQKIFKYESVDKQTIVQLLSEVMPNFQHMETGKNLDQKM
ncbi:MAG: polysaccharide biosynthesis protein [Saprospiraceae bacterium]